MNLIETATPIFYNSVIIGYIMIGQVRDKDSDFVGIAPSVSAIVPDIAAARRFYGELITVSEEQIRAASHILDVCAGYLYAKKLITLKNESIEKRIDEYIASNITGELTVNSLCRAFHTSRSELYHIFMSCFGKSVAAHIKYRRLEYAKELLKTTSLPVYKIAALCGIGDYNYFSKVFIKQYKISATAIRRS
jgi:AraC-like DNA-binding protein